MTRRTKQQKKSHAWHRQHVADPFVQRAVKEGWRSRAVFKLSEIDEKDRLLRPGMTVIELGASPGSWSQYIAARIRPRGRLLAIDRLPMAPLPGVEFIHGDFGDPQTLARLEAALGGEAADLVLSDMAPNLTGVAATDGARMAELINLALEFVEKTLKPGGDFLVKVFQGAEYMGIRARMARMFARLLTRKPAASRDKSAEIYLLGRGKR